MSSIVVTVLLSGFVLKPHLFSNFKYSDWFSKDFGSTVPKPYATNFKGIFFVTLGFFCLKEPPAAFRGFANCLLIFLKSDLDI